MNDHAHPDCFGEMFPNGLRLQANRPNRGKVFTVNLTKEAGFYPGFSRRSVETDVEQWDECQRCPVFDHCYKLCMAKVALESVVQNG
ncbi:radical SAM protein with 4Fe4S-binding SPASM domain [Rhodopirellula rubra]|uniref:Radical SAM protein with 4Fe4S-binding SPASM domain n=1 Tax=Aporhodopirellula rubra TaxID=980271 RepID=A0A7W5E302_9BACT|nr:hypothetical protein [Aporhodopirellula rubra]MBB3208887.1 radical SAM protein with 4Fe4S-binding SPASM domain [Aporhodopirellula rubra]